MKLNNMSNGDYMKKEYDFSNAKRGQFHSSDIVMNLPIYLDHEILSYFGEIANQKGIELNQMINELLRKDIDIIEEAKI